MRAEAEARVHQAAVELEERLAGYHRDHGGNPDFFAEKLLHVGDIVDSFRPRPGVTQEKTE